MTKRARELANELFASVSPDDPGRPHIIDLLEKYGEEVREAAAKTAEARKWQPAGSDVAKAGDFGAKQAAVDIREMPLP